MTIALIYGAAVIVIAVIVAAMRLGGLIAGLFLWLRSDICGLNKWMTGRTPGFAP